MQSDYKVLLLGSSGLTYSESGPEDAFGSLLSEELARRAPGVTWTCESVEVRPTRDMADRVAATVGREGADIVLLAPAGSYFTYEYVVVRLRHLSPWLYEKASAWTTSLKLLAGGGLEGSDSPRGWLFRGPRWVGARLLGMEPRMKVEHAIANNSEALRWLVKRENVVTICKLPTMSTELPPNRAAVYGRRLRQFQDAIRELCDDHHVPCYELREAMGEAGKTAQKGRDGAHWGPEIRRWEAVYLAGFILSHVDSEAGAAIGS